MEIYNSQGWGLEASQGHKTWDGVDTQKSVGTTLADTHSSGDMKPEKATSSSQTGTPVK